MARDCPCYSGLRYAECCAPLHKGERAAGTPEALMRSRYAAFALGLGEYLVDTLASTHLDREVPRAQLVREFAQLKDTRKFMGLRVVHAEGDEVLFDARIFQRGKNVSFAELSTFVREDGAWKYASGRLLAKSSLADGFTRQDFLEAAEREGA